MFKVKSNSLDIGNQTFNNTVSTIPTNKLMKTTTTKLPFNTNQYSSIRNFESTQSRLSSKPPIYYYRKVTDPYQYDIQKVDLKYSNKISDQQNFTDRVKKIIDKESNGTITLDDIMSQTTRSNDYFLPYGYIYYDYLKKNPQILGGNDLTLNKRNLKNFRNKNLNFVKNLTEDRFYNHINERENQFSDFRYNNEIKTHNDISNNNFNNNNNKEENKENLEKEENKEENEKENEENNDENNKIKTENNIELNPQNNIDENKIETEIKKEQNINKSQETNNNPPEKSQENQKEKPEISTQKNEEIENNENSNIKTLYPKLTQKEEIQYKYTQSDIFNLKKDNLFKNKSGEKYLFRPNTQLDKKKIHINYLSNSSWIPNIPKRTNYCGHTSVGYNIISPGKKSLFKTKEEIDRNSGIKLYNRIKAFSNFIDQNWQSSSRLTEQFSNSIKDKKPFNKKNNVASYYLDMHHTYKESIPHPFS